MTNAGHFLDKYTRIDNVLVNILEHMQQLQATQQNRELKVIYFAYPWDGTLQTLEAGTTTLDFGVGTIEDVNGTPTKMRHSLDSEGKDWLRSFFVNSDKFITVQPDNYDKIPADEEKDAVGTYQQFRKLKITCEEQTDVFVLCCTSPDAVIKLVSNTMVITDPKDVFGNRNYIGASELAARLGSINTFERRGNVIWMDDFEAPILRWKTNLNGSGASIELSTTTSLSGIQSAKLTAGTGASRACNIARYLTPTRNTRVGCEIAFTPHVYMDYLRFQLSAYNGTEKTFGIIKLDYDNDKVYYMASDGTYQDSGLSPQLKYSATLFRRLKFVYDYTTQTWDRIYLDDELIDISTKQMYTETNTTFKQLYVDLYIHGDGTNNPYVFIDNVIVTHNEP